MSNLTFIHTVYTVDQPVVEKLKWADFDDDIAVIIVDTNLIPN